jgi:hypothetical protein
MSRSSYTVAILSLCISFLFTALCLLLYPLWNDISTFLSTNFPVMLSAAILGGIYFAGLLYLLETDSFGQRRHYVLFILIDLILAGMLTYLLYELGTERTVLVRQALTALPYVLWFGAIILYWWFMPRLEILQSRPVMISFVVLLAMSALVWLNLPFSLKLTSRPAVFLRDNGAVVVWGTNMAATGEVADSLDGRPIAEITNRTNGLKDIGDRVIRVFIPLQYTPSSISLTAVSEGMKAIHPTSVDKAGKTSSETISVPFPAIGKPTSFVSFSDLHEQSELYDRLASQKPWDDIDLTVYNGDFLNSTVSPKQVTDSILDLRTGNRDLPRLLVRGSWMRYCCPRALIGTRLLPSEIPFSLFSMVGKTSLTTTRNMAGWSIFRPIIGNKRNGWKVYWHPVNLKRLSIDLCSCTSRSSAKTGYPLPLNRLHPYCCPTKRSI